LIDDFGLMIADFNTKGTRITKDTKFIYKETFVPFVCNLVSFVFNLLFDPQSGGS
jgi:hypothetical protein